VRRVRRLSYPSPKAYLRSRRPSNQSSNPPKKWSNKGRLPRFSKISSASVIYNPESTIQGLENTRAFKQMPSSMRAQDSASHVRSVRSATAQPLARVGRETAISTSAYLLSVNYRTSPHPQTLAPLQLKRTPRPLTDRQYQNLKPGPFRTCHLVLHVSGCSDQIYICVNCLLRCDRAIKRAHPGFWTDTPRGFQLRTRPCCTPSPSIGKSSSRMLLHPCKSSSRRMVSAHSEPGGLPLTSGNGLQE